MLYSSDPRFQMESRSATGIEYGTDYYLADLNRCKDRHGWHKTHFDHLIIRVWTISYVYNMYWSAWQRLSIVDIKLSSKKSRKPFTVKLWCLVSLWAIQHPSVIAAYLQRFKISARTQPFRFNMLTTSISTMLYISEIAGIADISGVKPQTSQV